MKSLRLPRLSRSFAPSITQKNKRKRSNRSDRSDAPRTIGRPVGLRSFRAPDLERGTTLLWALFVILLILWLLGFSLHVAGSLIHLLLVVALVVLVINFVSGRRAV
ncbi:MAG: lmo0937 family membrane protein [Terracidiphilus sp.]